MYRRLLGAVNGRLLLSDLPIKLGPAWREYVNQPQTEAEVQAIRRSIVRGQPFGGSDWTAKVTRQMGLEHTFRPRGRPAKAATQNKPQ